jgi:hypothetical protein
MCRISARWVPCFLDVNADGGKDDRRYHEEGHYFLNQVITCDEMWIHFLNRKANVWKHPSSPSPTKAIISKSAGTVMGIIFCDTYGVV